MVRMYQKDKELVATHIPLLVRAIDKSEGDILEIGTGYFSTLILHWISAIMKRHVYSYESREFWYNRAKKNETEFHHIVYCPTWDLADFDQRHWGLVFVDHSPNNRRPVEIARLANKCDFMVIHDTDPERDFMYGHQKALAPFKYRYDYERIKPYTTVVSNFFDVGDMV